ncbi:MAG: metal-sulfur cluster assembly factor [Acidimicrobiales bacterium]
MGAGSFTSSREAAESGAAPAPAPAPEWLRLSSDDVLEAVWEALGCVYDPELCLDVVSLGLIYDVREQDGTVVVDMTLTTPGCPAAEALPEMAKATILDALDGAGVDVQMRVVWEPPWNPTMMNDDAAGALGFRAPPQHDRGTRLTFGPRRSQST